MLIRPPARHTVESEVPEAVEAENLSYPPLALLSIGQFLLDQSDHEVRIVDGRVDTILGAEAHGVQAVVGVHVHRALGHERADDADTGLLAQDPELLACAAPTLWLRSSGARAGHALTASAGKPRVLPALMIPESVSRVKAATTDLGVKMTVCGQMGKDVEGTEAKSSTAHPACLPDRKQKSTPRSMPYQEGEGMLSQATE